MLMNKTYLGLRCAVSIGIIVWGLVATGCDPKDIPGLSSPNPTDTLKDQFFTAAEKLQLGIGIREFTNTYVDQESFLVDPSAFVGKVIIVGKNGIRNVWAPDVIF